MFIGVATNSTDTKVVHTNTIHGNSTHTLIVYVGVATNNAHTLILYVGTSTHTKVVGVHTNSRRGSGHNQYTY